MYFPIWKSIYSNLHFNNTKAKLFRSIVDEYYKPLHRKFFKIMYIYSQSKSFDLLTSFNWKQVTLMNQSPSSRNQQSSLKLLGRLLLTLVTYLLPLVSGSDINRFSSKSRWLPWEQYVSRVLASVPFRFSQNLGISCSSDSCFLVQSWINYIRAAAPGHRLWKIVLALFLA